MMHKWIIFLSLVTGSRSWSQSTDTLWQESLRKFQQQNYHGIVEDLNALLSCEPENANFHYNRGIAWLSLGDTERGCTDLRQAVVCGMTEKRKLVEYTCDPAWMRNALINEYYKEETVYPERGYRPRYTRADSLRGALRKERTCYDVFYYDLRVRIMPGKKRIRGENIIHFRIAEPTGRIQVDLFDNYTLTSVSWNGATLSWRREANALFIDFPRLLDTGETHILAIAYEGKPGIAPNPPWEGGFVWEKDQQKNHWLGVACEHLGASSWWPTKDHLSDKPDSMQITLDVPRGYQAVSNGTLRHTEPADRKFDRFVWFVHYPISNYNATFYVGKYVTFRDTLIGDRDTLSLDYYVLAPNLEIARRHFKQTREVLDFYNRVFGYYPFAKDGFSLVESPYEGMEHQSAIAYGHGYGKNNAQDYRNALYDFIIVHEAAHEWWGNSITAADMADIWIHEGFATYAEYLFLENRFGKEEYLYELAEKSRYIFNVWPLVQNRDVNENAFASNDVYHKGAMLLHCLRCTLDNDSLFFGIIRGFCEENRYKTVHSGDFIAYVNRITGEDHTAFFNKYLYDTALPVLSYAYARVDGNLSLRFRWTGVEAGFRMPFGIETSAREAMRLVADTTWQEITLPETYWFNFYNLRKGYAGSKNNSFTYYSTRCENP